MTGGAIAVTSTDAMPIKYRNIDIDTHLGLNELTTVR